ncbi:MAG TPA: hypothetical protein PLI95_26645 [Polyangiaceae bacterium]|nr:hypothetical protein [Polyangiaceae bacterium]
MTASPLLRAPGIRLALALALVTPVFAASGLARGQGAPAALPSASAAPDSSDPSPAPVPSASVAASAQAPSPAGSSESPIAKLRNPASGYRGIPRDRGIGWDLNIDGAYGTLLGEVDRDSKGTGFGRIRAGVLFANEPFYYALGPTFETSNLAGATFGLQGEVVNIGSGLYAQIGGLVDSHAKLGAMGALGWSLFGVEYQYRSYEDLGNVSALYAKVRIPISMIYRAVKSP